MTVASIDSWPASAAVDLAVVAGLDLDDRQVAALREGLRTRQDGMWEHFRYWCEDPIVLEARVLAGLLLFSDQRILWSGLRPEDTFRRLAGRFSLSPELSCLIKAIRKAKGEQRIELVNGSVLWFISTSGGSGHGFSADLLVVADSVRLTAARRDELSPVVLAASNPQIWYGR